MQTIERNPERVRSFTERFYEVQKSRAADGSGRLAVAEYVSLYNRFEDEVTSGFSEALDGRVVSEFEFDVLDGKIIAADGEQLEGMMLRARMRAYEVAQLNPLMQFVVDRFDEEINELHEQQAMTQIGATYNTLITQSPMTFELAHLPALLKKGFQRPDLGRSMSRISHWDGKRMHIITRSLDSSSLALLESTVRDALGHSYQSADSLSILRDRIKRSMTLDTARGLADSICSHYDNNYYLSTGIRTKQGMRLGAVDLVRFVQSHPEITANVRAEVEKFASECRSYEEFQSMFSSCLYRHLALFDEILQGRGLTGIDVSSSASDAGCRAEEIGIVYSMCGELIGGERDPIAIQTGFESLMLYSGKKVQCPNDKCRKMVVIEDKYLTDGVMHCKACKHTVDVCGDNAKALRIKKSEMKKAKKAENKAIKNAKKVLKNKSPERWSFFSARA
jgi:hypothetical protein